MISYHTLQQQKFSPVFIVAVYSQIVAYIAWCNILFVNGQICMSPAPVQSDVYTTVFVLWAAIVIYLGPDFRKKIIRCS